MKPSYDSIYLASRINETWNSDSLTPAALQKLVNTYGASRVEDNLRMMYGFPPKTCQKPFAYLRAMLENEEAMPLT